MAYFGFDNTPFLASLGAELAPDLATHAHVFLSHIFEFNGVPVVAVTAVHETLVPFPARIGGFIGEVGRLDGLPVEALSSCTHELSIVLRGPGSRRGSGW